MGDPVTSSVIAGGGQLGGAVVDKFVPDAQGREPKKSLYPEPRDYQALQDRNLAIIDSYLRKKGIEAFLPQPAGAVISNDPQSEDKSSGEKPTYDRSNDTPRPNWSQLGSLQNNSANRMSTQSEPETGEQVSTTSEQPKNADAGYPDAALAAALTARDLGITRAQPMFPTSRQFYEQDQARRRAELDRLSNFIYGARQLGNNGGYSG